MGLNIGIIGVGAIGGALKYYFEKKTDHKLWLKDPAKDMDDDISFCDAIFVCVPVPNIDGLQDVSILESVLAQCPGSANVFIRSTVLPGTADDYGVWSMPEFLTERIATAEMLRLPILTGCNDTDLMTEIFPDKDILMVSNKEAELAKYAHNCFGALKVNYFNIVNEMCERLNLNYINVLEGVLMSGFINDPHTQVPGPDGLYGFGGKCFPKDVEALYKMFPYPILNQIMVDNSRFRQQKVLTN